MLPVFLTHQDAGGRSTMTQLPQGESVTSSYLPNKVTKTLRLSSTDSVTHSSVRLDVHPTYVLLSAWDDLPGRNAFLINPDGTEVAIPISNTSQQVYMMLRDGDQFVSPAGRWVVEFDDDQNSISNSMRPPPLPIPSADDNNENGASFNDDTHEIGVEIQEVKNDELEKEKDIAEVEDEEKGQPNPMLTRQSSNILTSTDTSLKICAPNVNSEPHHNEDLSPLSDNQIGELSFQNEALNSQDHPKIQPPVSSTTFDNSDGISSSLPEQASSTASHVVISNESEQEKQAQEIVQNDPGDTSSATSSPEVRTKLPKRKISEIDDPEPTVVNKRSKSTLASIEGETTESDTDLSSNDILVKEGTTEHCETVSATKTSIRKADKKSKSFNQKRRVYNSRTTPPDSVQRRSHNVPEGTPMTSTGSTDSDIPLAVVFSSNSTIQTKKKTMAAFAQLGGRVVKSLEKADILCVPSGPLKKTAKFIIAIVTGKMIVTEDFIVQCQRRGKFPDPATFMPKDKDREKEWDFNISEAIGRGRNPHSGLTTLLSGQTIYITTQLKKELGSLVTELKDVALAMGVEAFRQRLPDKTNANDSSVLVLGSSHDSYANQIGKLGLPVYVKDLLTMSALRGRLEVDTPEFKVAPVIKQEDASSP